MLPTDVLEQIVNEISDGVYVVDRKRRILFWNQGAERITGYPASEVIGRACWNNLLEHVDQQGCQICFTGCPLAATMDDRAPREALISLMHRNGHRVPVHVHTRPLRNAEGVVWGAVETFSDATNEALSQAELEQLYQLALVDPLTELGNQRLLEGQIDSSLNALQRYGWGFGLLVLEIDHFAQVNDCSGHLVGDAIIRIVAATMANHLRCSDTVGRWDGEKFMVIVRHVQAPELRIIAEHLRGLVASAALPDPSGPISVTLSVGGTVARPDDTREALLERAEQQLDANKRAERK